MGIQLTNSLTEPDSSDMVFAYSFVKSGYLRIIAIGRAIPKTAGINIHRAMTGWRNRRSKNSSTGTTIACASSIVLWAIKSSNRPISSNNAPFSRPGAWSWKKPRFSRERCSSTRSFRRCMVLNAAVCVQIVAHESNTFCKTAATTATIAQNRALEKESVCRIRDKIIW